MAGYRSLALRFALVAGVIGLIGAALIVLGLREQLHRDFERQVVASASEVTQLIREATRAGMLHNRREDVKEVIQNIHQPNIVRIRIMNKAGQVVISSDEKEVGLKLQVSATECRACHEPGPPLPNVEREQRVRIWTDEKGERMLGMIEPVPGEPECSTSCHTHPAGQRVLGIIDTQMTLAHADRAFQAQSWRIIGGALLVQAVAAAAMVMMQGWMLRRRMKPMLGAIRRLGGGAYQTRIVSPAQDELAVLARAFNKMATDMERAHEELQQWAKTLQDRVTEKTRELQAAQDQMIRAERLACLGRLAAVVAHELNNPLSGVQVFARRAQKALTVPADVPHERAAEVAGWMETIGREVARCGRIVQDLLSFSRQRAPQRAPVDVNEIVRRTTRLLGHKLDLEEIDLALHLDDALPTVIADGAQIEQALLGVAVNAVEAMPKGGVLEITTRPYSGGGIEIAVKDTGTGIAPEVMPHIFEPFYTTKPEGQGTGLGLSVVYGIVSRHGGRLDISSAPGEGTTVTLVFPPGDLSEDDEGGGEQAEAPQVDQPAPCPPAENDKVTG
jgi:two-component system, NtrC family, sensor kinase